MVLKLLKIYSAFASPSKTNPSKIRILSECKFVIILFKYFKSLLDGNG